jgi:hypothetical protein
MLYREIIAVCSQIYTKAITAMYGQNEVWYCLRKNNEMVKQSLELVYEGMN